MDLSDANDTITFDFLSFSHGLTALLALNLLVGLPANAHVLWLIAGGEGGTVASELFALNLSISEILFCVLSVYLVSHFLLRMAMDVGNLVLMCSLKLIFVSRPVFQSCICLDRYLAVVHPTVFLRLKPLRYRLACCVVAWLLMLLYSLLPYFTLSQPQVTQLFISTSLLLLLLMLYCGVHVLCVLRRPAPGVGARDRSAAKRKAFKVILVTLVLTCSSQVLQVSVLGPALLSGQDVFLAVLLSLSGSTLGGFVSPLLLLHRAGRLPCIHI